MPCLCEGVSSLQQTRQDGLHPGSCPGCGGSSAVLRGRDVQLQALHNLVHLLQVASHFSAVEPHVNAHLKSLTE